jgi:hypothetical protein
LISSICVRILEDDLVSRISVRTFCFVALFCRSQKNGECEQMHTFLISFCRCCFRNASAGFKARPVLVLFRPMKDKYD